jgi:hypothetical protein
MTRVLAIVGLLLVASGAVRTSGATFTASAAPSHASFATAGDWVAPAVTLTAPAGAYVTTATPTLSGAAGTATGDLTTVTVRIYGGAAATGTPVQTRTATASGATWTTTATTLAEGQYTAQATQSDSVNTGTSAARTFTVDTVKPTAKTVSTTNKPGTTAGHLDSGDVVTFTYSEAVDPASVLAAWDGASTSVKVRFTNAGTFGASDTFTVLDASANANVHLGSVDAKGDFVSATTTFAATMARSADGASIAVTLGTPASVQTLAVTAKNMVWTVGAGIADPAGNAIATPATWTETDTDLDF